MILSPQSTQSCTGLLLRRGAECWRSAYPVFDREADWPNRTQREESVFWYMLAVGSLMHRAKSNSDIWGAGSLGPEIASKISVSDLKVHLQSIRGQFAVSDPLFNF